MRKVRGLFIPAGGNAEVREYETFEAFQNEVGGYVQVITNGNKSVLFDEEGKNKAVADPEGYRLNPLATLLSQGMLFRGDYIAGNAIILGSMKDESWNDVPEEVEKYAMNVEVI